MLPHRQLLILAFHPQVKLVTSRGMALVQMKYPVQAVNAQRLLDQVRPRSTNPVPALSGLTWPAPGLCANSFPSFLRVDVERLLLRKYWLTTRSKNSAGCGNWVCQARIFCCCRFPFFFSAGAGIGHRWRAAFPAPPRIVVAGLTTVLGRDAYLLFIRDIHPCLSLSIRAPSCVWWFHNPAGRTSGILGAEGPRRSPVPGMPFHR